MDSIVGGLALKDRADIGWRCQVCREPIADTNLGQVLFSDSPQTSDDFLVFHRSACDPLGAGPDDLLCTDTLAIVLSRAAGGEFGWAGIEFSARRSHSQ